MVPPAGNLLVELLKNTALASTIALTELTFRAQALRSETLRTVEIFTVTLVVYFVIARLIGFGMNRLETRVSRHRGDPRLAEGRAA
jgi:polar amino acid transport system permease protein